MSSTSVLPRTIFDPADSGYHTFRIPAVVVAGETLLAFCEGRRDSAADAGLIDLVLRRSTDRGQTWEPLQVVASAPGKTCGNPVPIVDPASGDVVLLTMQNGANAAETAINRGSDPEHGRRVYVQRSKDAGATWDQPREITEVKESNWGWYATGPCHGIALEHGPHAGRLVVPANHCLIPDEAALRQAQGTEVDLTRFNGGHCIISDDGGHSWRIGFVDRNLGTEINANETTVTELADGRIYFNSRNYRGSAARRVDAISTDGGETIEGTYEPCPDITAPDVQASVLRVGDRLLLSTPAHSERRRELTIFVSDDLGQSWRPAWVPHTEMAGYSDLVSVGDRVGLFFEGGEQSSYAQLHYLEFDPSELEI